MEEAAQLKVITDADWCGDKRSWKSTSGGAAMRCKYCFEDVVSHARSHRNGVLRMKGMKSMVVELGLAQ